MPRTLKKLAIASAAAVAITGTSLTVPTTADARNGWFGFGFPYMGWYPAYGYYDRYPYVYGADYGAADSHNPCVRWVPEGLWCQLLAACADLPVRKGRHHQIISGRPLQHLCQIPAPRTHGLR